MPLSRVTVQAHEELHAAVTAFLNGDTMASQQLVAETTSPRAVIAAAVRELAVAANTIAMLTGQDAQTVWRNICEAWARRPGAADDG